METFINLVHQAIAAFRRKEFAEVVFKIEMAFQFFDAIEYTRIEEKVFNAIYDAFEMMQLIAGLGIFEQNDFLSTTFDQFQESLDAFTKGEGGSVAELQSSNQQLQIILKGMVVAVYYCQENNWPLEVFPPKVSFGIQENATISLFAWSGTDLHQTLDVESLKQRFEELFEQQKQEMAYYFEASQVAIQNNQLEKAENLLLDGQNLYPNHKDEFCLQLGNLKIIQEDYEAALDYFMKAKVHGTPKYKFAEKGKKACEILIKRASTSENRSKWLKLLNNFF